MLGRDRAPTPGTISLASPLRQSVGWVDAREGGRKPVTSIAFAMVCQCDKTSGAVEGSQTSARRSLRALEQGPGGGVRASLPCLHHQWGNQNVGRVMQGPRVAPLHKIRKVGGMQPEVWPSVGDEAMENPDNTAMLSNSMSLQRWLGCSSGRQGALDEAARFIIRDGNASIDRPVAMIEPRLREKFCDVRRSALP